MLLQTKRTPARLLQRTGQPLQASTQSISSVHASNAIQASKQARRLCLHLAVLLARGQELKRVDEESNVTVALLGQLLQPTQSYLQPT